MSTTEELCRPLFQYITKLYRLNEAGVEPEYTKVRDEILCCFSKMHDDVMGNTILADQLSKLELPLIFFVDYMIKEGPFKFKSQWIELAKNFNELSGDEKFFDLLDETLNDPSPLATERLGVFYTCLALGFNGCYSSDPEYIERKMRICALRLGIDAQSATNQDLSVDVYKSVSREKRFANPIKSALSILILSIFVLLFAIALNMFIFHKNVYPIRKQLNRILTKSASQYDISHVKPVRYKPKTGESDKEKFFGPLKPDIRVKYENRLKEIRASSWFSGYEAGKNLDWNFNPNLAQKEANEKKPIKNNTENKGQTEQ